MSALSLTRPLSSANHITPPQSLLQRLSDLTACLPTSEDRFDTVQLFRRLFDVHHNQFPCSIYEKAHLRAQAARLTEENRLGFAEFTRDWLNDRVAKRQRRQRRRRERARRESGGSAGSSRQNPGPSSDAASDWDLAVRQANMALDFLSSRESEINTSSSENSDSMFGGSGIGYFESDSNHSETAVDYSDQVSVIEEPLSEGVVRLRYSVGGLTGMFEGTEWFDGLNQVPNNRRHVPRDSDSDESESSMSIW